MPQFEFATVFWPQIIWLGLLFAVLYFLVIGPTLPKIGRVMEERETRISGDIGAAEAARGSAEDVETRLREELATSREEARLAVEKSLSTARGKIETKLAKANAETQAAMAAAEDRIALASKAAGEQIEAIAAESAQDIVARLSPAKPTLAAAKAAVRKVAG